MTIRPVRLRLSRAKGFNLQEHSRAVNGLSAIKVDRSTRWGNPFDFRRSEYCWAALSWGCRGDARGRQEASVRAFSEWMRQPYGRRVKYYEEQTKMGRGKKWVNLGPKVEAGETPPIDDVIAALRGKNLACWCALDAPCHADVLLELANRPICEEVTP
jgi:hypothetical protein